MFWNDFFFIGLFLFTTLMLIGIPGFVERVVLFSLEVAIWLLMLFMLIFYLRAITIMYFLILMLLILWITYLYFLNWHGCFFKANRRQIMNYNKRYGNTFHIIPVSTKRVIPNAYNMILTLLVIINILMFFRLII